MSIGRSGNSPEVYHKRRAILEGSETHRARASRSVAKRTAERKAYGADKIPDRDLPVLTLLDCCERLQHEHSPSDAERSDSPPRFLLFKH